MFRQPFKPPLLQRRPLESDLSADNKPNEASTTPTARTTSNGSTGSVSRRYDEETRRPIKKQRTSDETESVITEERRVDLKPFKAPKLIRRPYHLDSSTLVPNTSQSTNPERKPLQTVPNESTTPIPRTNSLPAQPNQKGLKPSFIRPSIKAEVKNTLREEPSGAIESFYLVLWLVSRLPVKVANCPGENRLRKRTRPGMAMVYSASSKGMLICKTYLGANSAARHANWPVQCSQERD
jgi:hypothetical protein